jgi:hypothetical protein
MKKTILALPVAALVAVGLVACDSNSSGLLAPDDALAKAISQEVEVKGSFTIANGGGQPVWQLTQDGLDYGNPLVERECVAASGVFRYGPPGRDQELFNPPNDYCELQGGGETYTFAWDARNVENRSTTHLMFTDDDNVRDAGSRGSVGQGTTPVAQVYKGVDVVGTVTVDLTQFTQPMNVFVQALLDGLRTGSCLNPREYEDDDLVDRTVYVDFVRTAAEGPASGTYPLNVICWDLDL